MVGDTVYIGGRDAKEYALDAATGVTKWSFDATTVSGPSSGSAPNPLRDAPAISGDRMVFGDSHGSLYELNRRTGKLIWAVRLSPIRTRS